RTIRTTPLIRRRPDATSQPQAAAVAVAVAVGSRYGRHRVGIRGAASRMKSTGAGGRGCRRSVIETSSGVRLPFRRLHGAHDVTTFSQTDSPPRLRGTTWSS